MMLFVGVTHWNIGHPRSASVIEVSATHRSAHFSLGESHEAKCDTRGIDAHRGIRPCSTRVLRVRRARTERISNVACP